MDTKAYQKGNIYCAYAVQYCERTFEYHHHPHPIGRPCTFDNGIGYCLNTTCVPRVHHATSREVLDYVQSQYLFFCFWTGYQRSSVVCEFNQTCEWREKAVHQGRVIFWLFFSLIPTVGIKMSRKSPKWINFESIFLTNHMLHLR